MPFPIRDLLPLLAKDGLAATGLLTRIAVPFAAPRPAGVWAWPVVGGCVGLVIAGVGAAALWAGLTPLVAAALMIGTETLLTGALHEDGLADCADGFWGGHDRERRLEIMKDSRVGSYGVLALVIAGLLRWSALASVVATQNWGAVIAVAVLARAPMAVVMIALPNARGAGLAARHGAPDPIAAAVGVALAIGLTLALAGGLGLAMAGGAAGAALAVALTAKAKIGGQTGDVLGATEQMALIAALLVASAK